MFKNPLLRRISVHAGRWLADHLGFEHGEPFLQSARALAGDAEVLFPRELVPLLALNVGRGLFAAQIFQLPSDWVWPYWVVRQLDPADPAYTPRGMSPLWMNGTHRSWTAIGVLDAEDEAIVDPRGLVTPWPRGPSIDCAVRVGERLHAPSRLGEGYAQSAAADMPCVVGRFRAGPLEVETRAWCERLEGVDLAVVECAVEAVAGVGAGRILLSLRPFNPEGPALVRRIERVESGWLADGAPAVVFARRPDAQVLSTFADGDALARDASARFAVECPFAMASAVASFGFDLARGKRSSVRAAAFMHRERVCRDDAARVAATLRDRRQLGPSRSVRGAWRRRIDEGADFEFPEPQLQRLFERARLTLLVLDDGDSIKPGPATYHQRWFRDSAYLVGALARLGYERRARLKLEDYPARQDVHGYFRSQDGEWDSNGQAIWTLVEHFRLFGDRALLTASFQAIAGGARWIVAKRRSGWRGPGEAGLLPRGLSAEHLGPHACYLWDDFWGVAGLRAAAEAGRVLGFPDLAAELEEDARRFTSDIDRALEHARRRVGRDAMPAAPDRRLDAGMIGNVVAAYPLELMSPDDPRMVDTLAALEERFFVDGAFLHPIVHSGYNAYLTLHCAEVYLMAGRRDDAWRLAQRVAALASPTGAWPEALHPLTLGGCMGDGCHGWAAADFVRFLRNTLVLEREGELRLTPIFPEAWRGTFGGRRLPTYFGEVSLEIDRPSDDRVRLDLEVVPRGDAPRIVWVLPRPAVEAMADGCSLDVDGPRVAVPAGARTVKVRLGYGELKSLEGAHPPR